MKHYIYSIKQWSQSIRSFWRLPESSHTSALENFRDLPENSVAQISAGVHLLR